MYIVKRDILGVYRKHPAAVVHVEGHARAGDYEIRLQPRIAVQLLPGAGLSRKPASRSQAQALCVHLLYSFLYLKQPCTARYAVRLEGRRHREANGLVGAALVRHHQIRVQRVKPPLGTLHGGIKALEVYGDVDAP